MGMMIDGRYLTEDPAPDSADDGAFRRSRANIRNWITKDGPYTPDADRYHLYASWNCPWAHRVLLTIALLDLPVTVSYARPRRTPQGWVYDETGEFADPLMGIGALHQAYARVSPSYTGRLTVPLLWDKKTDTAVSNESADIVRMLARGFPGGTDLSPPEWEAEIDRWNALIYRDVNNGVYRAGFARTQEAYDKGVHDVFAALDRIEDHLASHRWLVGNRFTEADLRLFPTLARFDVGYHYAFKCNIRRLMDYPHLWAYAREIYQMPRVAATVRFQVYKQGYFSPSELRNPLGIVPAGPDVDWTVPHGRGAT